MWVNMNARQKTSVIRQPGLDAITATESHIHPGPHMTCSKSWKIRDIRKIQHIRRGGVGGIPLIESESEFQMFKLL